MILEQNLRFLSKRVKEILKDTKEASLEYKINKEGIKIPFYNKVSIHSLYNPFVENKNYDFKENTLIISIGFGAGYHLVNLISKYKEIIVVLFEFGIFKSIVSNIDLTTFFNENNLKIITLDEILDYYDFFHYESYQIIYPLSYERIFSSVLLENIRNIKAVLNNKIVDINIQKKFGKIWHKNILKNIKYFDRFNNSPLTIDKPILITGAGYSLIENINLIKRLRNFIYLAATDTSLKILDSYGITPDSVFTFDCQNWTLHHFLALKNYNFRLFMDFTVRIPSEKIENITLLFSNHPFKNFFLQQKNRSQIDSSSGNIGASTIDFFYRYFKDIPIITCGIDYGIYNYFVYAKGSSITINNNIKSNFFQTMDNFDTRILYNYNIKDRNGIWCTNSLLKSYSEFCKNLPYVTEIFTLSNSPFTNFTKIENFEIFLNNISIKEKTLYFSKIDIDNLYNNFKNFLCKNRDALMPYFLAIKKIPDEETIKNLIDYSIDFLKQK